MRYGLISCFLLLILCIANASGKSIVTREIILEGKHNKTICIQGDSSFLKFWSYREIIISPKWGDVQLKINSPDSSFFPFVMSFLNRGIFNIFSDLHWYDVFSQKGLPSRIFASPFGRTCISITNPYSQKDYPMDILLQVETHISLLYPCLFAISCLLFIYSRLLCTSASFYYIFFIITAPFMLPFYLLAHLILTLFRRQSIAFFSISLLFINYTRYLFQHAFHPLLYSVILNYPIIVFIYCVIAYIGIFYVISSQLSKLRKRDIQTIYTVLRGCCVVLVLHSTASISVALIVLLILFVVGFSTQRLKLTNLLKEWKVVHSLIQPEANAPIQCDIAVVDNARQQLQSLKLKLQRNNDIIMKLNPTFLNEFSLFVHSDSLFIPSSEFLRYITRLLQTTPLNAPISQPILSDSILLDEAGAEVPFFPPQPSLSFPSNPIAENRPVYNFQNNPLDNTYYQAFGPTNNRMLYHRVT